MTKTFGGYSPRKYTDYLRVAEDAAVAVALPQLLVPPVAVEAAKRTRGSRAVKKDAALDGVAILGIPLRIIFDIATILSN